METAEKIIAKRTRSRRAKRDYLSALVIPVVVALVVSLICGALGFLINSAKSETKIEKLEKDVDYIRQRQDYLIDKLIPSAK